MKIFLTTILCFLLIVTPFALGACPDISIATFAKDLAFAYAENKLVSLDEQYPNLGPITVFFEHSIGQEKDGDIIFTTYVGSFRDLAKILESRRTDGLPKPESRSLRKCSNSVYTYDFFNGIQHNTLYLKEIRYNDYKKCLEIESVWFLDGD